MISMTLEDNPTIDPFTGGFMHGAHQFLSQRASARMTSQDFILRGHLSKHVALSENGVYQWFTKGFVSFISLVMLHGGLLVWEDLCVLVAPICFSIRFKACRCSSEKLHSSRRWKALVSSSLIKRVAEQISLLRQRPKLSGNPETWWTMSVPIHSFLQHEVVHYSYHLCWTKEYSFTFCCPVASRVVRREAAWYTDLAQVNGSSQNRLQRRTLQPAHS